MAQQAGQQSRHRIAPDIQLHLLNVGPVVVEPGTVGEREPRAPTRLDDRGTGWAYADAARSAVGRQFHGHGEQRVVDFGGLAVLLLYGPAQPA